MQHLFGYRHKKSCYYVGMFLYNHRYAGQVGYLICGMKMTKEAQIGDTIYQDKVPVKSLPGFKPAKPMVSDGASLDDNYWLVFNIRTPYLTVSIGF